MTTAEPADDQPALQMLGIALRAGRLSVGTEAVCRDARTGELVLAVVARDAGENARHRVIPVMRREGIPVVECGTRTEFGRALGRSATVAAGLTDDGLARAVRERLPDRRSRD